MRGCLAPAPFPPVASPAIFQDTTTTCPSLDFIRYFPPLVHPDKDEPRLQL